MSPHLLELDGEYLTHAKQAIETILHVEVGDIIDVTHGQKSSQPCNPPNQMKVGAIGVHFIEGTSLGVVSATLYCNCGQSATLTSEGITLNENRL